MPHSAPVSEGRLKRSRRKTPANNYVTSIQAYAKVFAQKQMQILLNKCFGPNEMEESKQQIEVADEAGGGRSGGGVGSSDGACKM